MSLSAYEISALLDKEVSSLSQVKLRRQFYEGFDQAAVFLLGMKIEDLFEPAGRGEWYFRCKGCRQICVRTDRKDHHSNHKREYEKIRES